MIQDQEWFEENPTGPKNTRKWSGKKRDGRIPLPMAKIVIRGDVCGKAVSWELRTTLGWWREGRRPDFTLHSQDNFKGECSVEAVTWEFHGRDIGAIHGEILSILEVYDKACTGGAWPNIIRGGTRSSMIKYKDAPVVRARLIGSIGTWFHGRLGKCEDSSVLSHVGWLVD
ncbi:hypothetical protein F2Q68_00044447 [Brassica cretica]|uniref:Uncharacterized protein n=1 Tax=Brassica cretica TaxID=69181 RepID=A0A8S9LRP2_BRACR|nr:hypothetical protein F2Q68_00044447 [Brassica cretica]